MAAAVRRIQAIRVKETSAQRRSTLVAVRSRPKFSDLRIVPLRGFHNADDREAATTKNGIAAICNFILGITLTCTISLRHIYIQMKRSSSVTVAEWSLNLWRRDSLPSCAAGDFALQANAGQRDEDARRGRRASNDRSQTREGGGPPTTDHRRERAAGLQRQITDARGRRASNRHPRCDDAGEGAPRESRSSKKKAGPDCSGPGWKPPANERRANR
jgi:hypothetical protein